MFVSYIKKSIAAKNASLHGLDQDISLVANLQSQMHAQHVQAQQLLQAQQISNIIHGSQQHLPSSPGNHRSPMSQTNYGSLSHISQTHSQQQPIYFNNIRAMGRDSNQFINDQGQYMSPLSNNHQSYIDSENGSGGILQYEQSHQVRELYMLFPLHYGIIFSN